MDLIQQLFAKIGLSLPRTLSYPPIPFSLIQRDTPETSQFYQHMKEDGFVVISLQDHYEDIQDIYEVGKTFLQADKEVKNVHLDPKDENLGYVDIAGVRQYIKLRITGDRNGNWPTQPPEFKEKLLIGSHILHDVAWKLFIELLHLSDQEPTRLSEPFGDDVLLSLNECVKQMSSLSVIHYYPQIAEERSPSPSPSTSPTPSPRPTRSYSLSSSPLASTSSSSASNSPRPSTSVSTPRSTQSRSSLSMPFSAFLETISPSPRSVDKASYGLRDVCDEHTDTGIFTIILCSQVAGLQVWDRKYNDWLPVEKVLLETYKKEGESLAVCIMGEKIGLFTDVLNATLHRVMIQPNKERQSLLYFMDTAK